MTTIVIPEKRTKVCDKCGGCDKSKKFTTGCVVQCRRSALDMYGQPAADAGFLIDLCDECAKEFVKQYHVRGDCNESTSS